MSGPRPLRPADLLFETLVLRSRAAPGDLAAAWARPGPRGLAPLVRHERAELWLWRRLREIGVAGAGAGAPWPALAEAARRDAASNLLVEAEAERVMARLRDLGVPCVLIKGIARRVAAAHWPYGDARPTHDVDCIVPEDQAERAWEALVARGYRRYSEATSPHELPGLLGEGQVSVDIHVSLAHALPPCEAWRRAVTDALTVRWREMDVRVPCATELLWHGLVHALQHGTEAWRLRFLLDGASILAGPDPVAWDELRRRRDAGEVEARSAGPWLAAAAELAGVTLPEDWQQGGGRFDERRALRWRGAVLARWPDAGMGARLLEEATRIEAGQGPAPAVAGQGLLKGVRRFVAGRIARLTYRAWRVTESAAR